ncbi:MAG: amidohydrolase [Planctomycetota bacterium]|nr:amidohydrolase [Planctomycetota bacterium]
MNRLALLGRVHLPDPGIGGVLIEDGKIAQVGSREDVAAAAAASGARVVELPPEALIAAGCVDAHLHLIHMGERLALADLSRAGSPEEAARILADQARALPEGAWVRGSGWREDRLGRMPCARDLDALLPGRPVAASAFDGHTLWVNAAALAAAGIAQGTPDPEGGTIRREASGQPTGILHENACGLVWSRIPPPTRAESKAFLLAAARACAAAGFTGVHDVQDLLTVELACELEAEGLLPVRVSGMCRAHDLDSGEAALWLHEVRENRLVRLIALKLFLDGTFTSRTAWMLTPYKEGGTGLNVLALEELDARMREAARLALGTAVHVIGDRALRAWLDTVDRFRREPPKVQPSVVDQWRGYPHLRMRAEHAQLIDPADLPRFKALAVAASVQPSHLVPDFPVLREHFPHRSACAYPFRGLLEAGAPVCLSSDAPIMPPSIGQTLHAAVNRAPWPGEGGSNAGWHAEQHLTVAEVLRLYAEGAAWAEDLEATRGRIAVGFDADLTIFAADPAALPAEDLVRAAVLGTVVNGEAQLPDGM